jgi:GcrA cell cycle regulator
MVFWTLERNRALRRWRAAGLSTEEIAYKLNTSVHNVRRKIQILKQEVDPDTCERMIEMWNTGHGYSAIGRAFGKNPFVIRSVLGRLGIVPPVKRKKPKSFPIHKKMKEWEAKHDEQLRILRAQGFGCVRAARYMGFSSSTIAIHSRKLNLGPAPTRGWSDEKEAMLRQYVDSGLSAAEIAKFMGISRNSVIGKVTRLGLKLKTPPHKGKGRHGGRKPGSRIIRPNERCNRFHKSLKSDDLHDLPEEKSDTAVPFLELKDGQCHWPVWGEKLNMHCCGKQVVPHTSYCPEHKARLSRPAPEINPEPLW